MHLTVREREVCDLASLGFTVRYIAERLFLSPRTVETHLRRVYEKTGVTCRDELIELYSFGARVVGREGEEAVKKIYVWEATDPVSVQWHSGGGLLIVCDEGEYATKWAEWVAEYNAEGGYGDLKLGAVDVAPDYVFDTTETADRVLTFPNAGCC